MDNKIILYKVEFTYSGIKQPYFMSDTARDKYFEKLQGRQVNGTGVNIKVGKGLSLNFKANIDVTVAQDYNFAIVEYNNKKYYCNILDCEHINVNMCWIYAQRNPLFEITNYWQYYEHFDISRLSTNKFRLGKDSPFTEPKFRYQDAVIYYPYFKFYSGTISQYIDYTKVEYLQFYLLNLSQKVGDIWNASGKVFTSRYGYSYENYTVLLPTRESYKRSFLCYDGGKDILGNYGKQIYNWNLTNAQRNTYIEKLSPYIQSIQLISLPILTINSDGFPYYFMPFIGSFEQIINIGADGPKVFNIKQFGKSTYDIQEEDIDITKYVDFSLEYTLSINPNEQLYITCGNSQNEMRINPFDYMDTFASVNITVKFSYIFEYSGMSIMAVVYPSNYNGKIIKNTFYYFPLQTENPFLVDEAAKWNAENKYYSQLSGSYRVQKTINSALQTAENFATGGLQLGVAGMIADTAKPGQYTWGGMEASAGGNLIRGSSSLAQTVSDNIFQGYQNKLIAKQAREAPSSMFTTTDSSSERLYSHYLIRFYRSIAYDNDYNSFIEEIKYLGSETILTVDKIDTEFINKYATVDTNGKWLFMSAITRLGVNSNFQDELFMTLHNITKNGCVYKIIEDE